VAGSSDSVGDRHGEENQTADTNLTLTTTTYLEGRSATPLVSESGAWRYHLEVDTATLKSCVESGRMQARIHADTMYGQQLQVSNTPTMFINETRVVGTRSEGELVALIRQELDRVQRTNQ
jgi:hypothetical protein